MIAEFKVVPIGSGESPSRYVAERVRIVDRSGLKYELPQWVQSSKAA